MEVGGYTFLSRIFGIIREMLMVRYLGASAVSDAFLTAFKIPNSLRKIFAEGALSAAFVPTIVHAVHERGAVAANSLMSLSFIFFEGFLLLVVIVSTIYAQNIISLVAPGFSEETVAIATPCLQILMSLILFLSSNALFAGAMQSVGHFAVPASSPIILNIIFIFGLLVCLFQGLPVTTLCWFIMLGGFIQFIMHLWIYKRLGFGFGSFERSDFKQFTTLLARFGLCFMSMSVMEISLFIDTSFGSYLPEGSLSLIYYGYRFMGIPLGVFATAFATILLPHFSKISLYAHRRLGFYLLESAKLIFMVTIPFTLLMIFFSHDIFITLFLSKKFTIEHVRQAAQILSVFLIGLFFFSFNKILLNVYYALRVAWIPALIAAGATVINIFCNMFFLYILQAPGLALATVMSGIIQTIVMATILKKKFNISIHGYRFIEFAKSFLIQLLIHAALFIACYYVVRNIIISVCTESVLLLLTQTVLFWLWVSPMVLLMIISLYVTRHQFGIKSYFLD